MERKNILIIEGVHENGSTFRPSDWSERISSTYATFGKDHRLHYTKGVSPWMIDGQKVLAMDVSLRELNPTIFNSVMTFANENKLRIREEVHTLN